MAERHMEVYVSEKKPQLENSYFDTNFVYEMFHTHHIAGGLINE